MNLTTLVGQRILAVDLICIYYVLGWKICGMYRRQHQPQQWQHVGDVAHLLHSVCLMELCGVLLCHGKMACWCTVYMCLGCQIKYIVIQL